MLSSLRAHRPRLAAGVVVVLTMLVGLVLLLESKLARASYDIPFAWRPALPAGDIRLIYLDDVSHRELRQVIGGRWDRTLHARLIDRLTAAGARLIVFDVIFAGASANPAADAALAAAMKRSGRVVIGGFYHHDQPDWEEMPDEPFRSAAVGWGNTDFMLDPDGGLRRSFPDVKNLPGQPDVPWLPRRAAQLAAHAAAPLHAGGWFNFAGPPGTFSSVSYYRALEPDGVPPNFFRDKIVFVGAQSPAGFTGENKDTYRTPYSDWGWPASPGVDFLATATLDTMRNIWLSPLSTTSEIILNLLLALGLSLGLLRLSPLWAALAAAAGALVVAGLACLLAWYAHIWIDWLVIIVEIVVALFCSVVWNSIQVYVEKRLVEESLAAHLSPAIVKRLVADPALRQVGGVKQEVSIIFTDIANFSRVSEMMHPDDLVNLLNRYFEAALNCIHRTDGTVVDLIGDAIFAIWNAPVGQTDHRERACRAAIELQSQLVEFESTHRNLLLRTRVGLHTGVACVGNIGSAIRFDYTAIGESINLASRLEGLNKHIGSNILASREIQRAVENELATRLIGHFKFKGFGRAVEIHELIGGRDQIEPTRVWREKFADALQDFRGGKFEEAAVKFKAVHGLRQNNEPDMATASGLTAVDGPSRFYLEKIEEFRVKPPPSDWVGEVELKEK
ncbi:MAG TPA: adenylate/guanylate cyclase domain-containing protein [Verrucomicrobiae bacterium]|jgi:adenylate cyclase|nr:adenylate/guanylate cyclase domain-containing protein [Verrucomicrobiae bacterium]